MSQLVSDVVDVDEQRPKSKRYGLLIANVRWEERNRASNRQLQCL